MSSPIQDKPSSTQHKAAADSKTLAGKRRKTLIKNVLCLAGAFVLMCLVAVSRDKMLFGKQVDDLFHSEKGQVATAANSRETAASTATNSSEETAASTNQTAQASTGATAQASTGATAQANTGAAAQKAAEEPTADKAEPEKAEAKKAEAKKAEQQKPTAEKAAETAEKWEFTVSSEGAGVEPEGFNGPVPVEVTFVDGKVAKVTPLANDETPRFFALLTDAGFFSRWDGMTAAQAAETQIDAISGATYSSEAAIANVRYAAREAERSILSDSKSHVTTAPEPQKAAAKVQPSSQKADTQSASRKTDAQGAAKKADGQTGATSKADARTGAMTQTEGGQADQAAALPEGGTVYSTEGKAVGTDGYNGPVPVEILLKDGKILDIRPLPNKETPGFFNRVIQSGMLDKWKGLTPQEALGVKVDAVTGATYSSKALIANVRYCLTEIVRASGDKAAAAAAPTDRPDGDQLALKIASMAVILCGCFGPLLIRKKKQLYRKVQLLLNVAVLGFLTGTFLSYSLIVRTLGHGLEWGAGLVALLMLFAAFLMPLFGHKNHYCLWICPLGSAQELLGSLNHKRHIHIGPKTAHGLKIFRVTLWGTLMALMWAGVWFEWMDYEPFAAFRFWQASAAVIALGAAILILSVFTPRPYCRFLCPTGTLFRQAEGEL